MGCDIHCYKEKLVGGLWVTADTWTQSEWSDGFEVSYHDRFNDRNYQLFGVLASGVRAESEFSFTPRGIPFDACSEIKTESESWGSDGHSHSFLYLHELKLLADYIKTRTFKISGLKDKDGLAILQESISSGNPDWNLLFPYCGGTNNPNYVPFEVEVPASFYIGQSLDELIKGFECVDGDNQRIVFFFDN